MDPLFEERISPGSDSGFCTLTVAVKSGAVLGFSMIDCMHSFSRPQNAESIPETQDRILAPNTRWENSHFVGLIEFSGSRERFNAELLKQ